MHSDFRYKLVFTCGILIRDNILMQCHGDFIDVKNSIREIPHK